MTPTDLLDLRRRVARVLPAERRWSWAEPGRGLLSRCGGSLWEDVTPNSREVDWLPVLEDDGTIGVLLGELVRRVSLTGGEVMAWPGDPARRRLAEVECCWGAAARAEHGLEYPDFAQHGDHLGHALAAALVAVSEAP
jgi:hypothetical protein